MAKVSVLVAVYNAEQWLPQCLDSLLSQTMGDFQVICVDDASTDNSLQILKEYAAGDKRIEVIALSKNSGQAHARNLALQQAKGDYTCFLDADDWYAPDTLQLMTEAFHADTDCVLLDVIMHYGNHEEHYPMPPFETLDGNDAFTKSLTWQIHGVYGVRTELHKRFPYDETCRSYSDDNTTRLHFLNSRTIRRCNGRYYYRQHSQSVTHQVSIRRFDYLRANVSMRQQLVNLNVKNELLNIYENHRWLNLVGVYMFYHVHGKQLNKDERRYGLKELKSAWKGIDCEALNKKTTAKLGYRHYNHWWMFRLQEWLYFTLRGFLGKNY